MNDEDTPPTYLADERDPTGQLGPEPWLVAPETRTLMGALTIDGGRARFVGGCVRDGLLRRQDRDVRDVDIATTELPDRVMELLGRAGVKVVPTGLEHGTVKAIVGSFSYEITTLRRDTACDGRHSEVEFTTSFREDALRRDFTINALCADLDGFVYDYVDGMRDLSAGRVCFIGRAMDRIEEDHLRILRFFRFYAWYGVGRVDNDAFSACKSLAESVDDLSAERVRAEFVRLLESPEPTNALSLMQGARVLNRILPETGDIADLRTLVMLETHGLEEGLIFPDPFRRLASLMGAGGSRMVRLEADTFARLRLSRAETDRMAGLLCPDARRWPGPETGEAELRHLLSEDGTEMISDRIVLRWAVERSESLSIKSERTLAWRRLLEYARFWAPPGFPVRGEDLMERGLKGPAVGRALDLLKRLWIDEDCALSRDTLLARWDKAYHTVKAGLDDDPLT